MGGVDAIAEVPTLAKGIDVVAPGAESASRRRVP
jgi:hypothetical protein